MPDLLPAGAALDSGTRELDPGRAAAIAGDLARHLAGAAIAFKKVDSLMRGPAVAELAACLRAGGRRRCVLAPAFPYQGRITRDARQHARGQDGDWIAVGGDLIAGLRERGAAAQAGRLDADLPPGVSVFAAETDDDLRQVVATVRRSARPVLWSGTGGLAQAIAAATCPRLAAPLPRPVLGLFGSDQPATARQPAACAPHWTRLPNGGPSIARVIASLLDANGMALASFSHPAGTPRAAAGQRIARETERLVRGIEPPGSVVVAGGETLRGLCRSVGATSLEVQGRMVPGVPWCGAAGGAASRSSPSRGPSAPPTFCANCWASPVHPRRQAAAARRTRLPRQTSLLPRRRLQGEHHDQPTACHHHGRPGRHRPRDHRLRAGQYDAVIANYHDQGHTPVKLLGFEIDPGTGRWDALSGVNITLGLPIIRTSVGHGTAFDIAGTGIASARSLVEAIEYAERLAAG